MAATSMTRREHDGGSLGAGDGDGAGFKGLAEEASRTWRENSGSSSRKRMPLWARETSPGRGMVPPPMTEGPDAV